MKPKVRRIYCCGCWAHVEARKTTGREVYPHRDDLHGKVFYVCDTCSNYVGCHKNTDKPLGVIPTPEIRAARQRVHNAIDPYWKSGRIKRGDLYHKIGCHIGNEYHTANIISVKSADDIIAFVNGLMAK